MNGEESDAQVQYSTFSDGDTHEGEVLHEEHAHPVAADYHPYREQENQQHTGYPAPTYVYPAAPTTSHLHPYPPPPPPPPPPPVPPHKSKQTPLYTYYYLGRHLWYIPLYFSIYFIIYVGLLVLKSIARHKIQFPQNLHEAAITRDQHVLRSIHTARQRYFM